MRHVRVKVRRDSNTMHNRSGPAWEVPILEAIFEEGNIEVTDEYVDAPDAEYPDAQSEYRRLTDAYGKDPDTGVPYAAIAFGNGSRGVKALRTAIEAEQAAEDEAKAATSKPASRQPAKRKRADADSLLA